MNLIFESIPFQENLCYERIISDIVSRKHSIIDDFFSSEIVTLLRESLIKKHDANRFKKAAVGNRVNEVIVNSIRGDQILWIDELVSNPAEKLFFEQINELVNYLNKTCFLGILNKEFHYALYPKGTFYKRHIDTFQNDDRRRLSFVCYLNAEDWNIENGGELVLYLNQDGTETEKIIYPLPGRMVVFESQLIEHEVKLVKLERLSITGWLKTS